MNKKSIYIEILSLTNGLVILFLLTKRKEFLYASVLVALASVVSAQFANLLGGGLQKIVQTIGRFTNILFLGIVYIFFLTPIAVLYRLFRKKELKRDNMGSFFMERGDEFVPDDFDKQW